MDESRLDSKTSLKRKIVPTADFEAETLERVFVFAANVGCQLSDCFGCCIGRCIVTLAKCYQAFIYNQVFVVLACHYRPWAVVVTQVVAH